MKQKGFIVLALVVVSIFLITSAPQAEQKFLRMFSGPEGGSWYPLGSAMMGIVEKSTGISSSNGPGGGVGNCKAVNGGRADLGWTYTHTAFNAYNGRGKFDKKNENLRHLMSLYPGVFQMAVPKRTASRLSSRKWPQGLVTFMPIHDMTRISITLDFWLLRHRHEQTNETV